MSESLFPDSRAIKKRDEHRRTLKEVTVRIAGDSGDGIQTAGAQFTLETALAGNDLATFPDFPSEIRAPAGTIYGVSSYQVHLSSEPIHTPGDQLDVLVAFNPAALKTNVRDVKKGGLIITDCGGFTERAIAKAGYNSNPLEDGSLSGYQRFCLDISKMVREVIAELPDAGASSHKDVLRAKNMWVLGLILWFFGRDRRATLDWIARKFADKPDIAAINRAALEAGYAFGATAELPQGLEPVQVPPAAHEPGTYRTITGTEALVFGLAAGALDHGLTAVYCSYPITPATNILHGLAKLGEAAGIRTFQAEDEIAAVCAAIGASYAGQIGITGTSGPGMALKTEALGLAVAAELPLVVIDVQRGGPSTGLPTKSEQSDLFQAVMGRNADTPLVVLAIPSPAAGFEVAQEAIRLAITYMTPVIVLSDGYLANASETWRLPDLPERPRHPVCSRVAPADFAPFRRDETTLARPWVAPGTPGGIHRLGGLERKDVTGEVSYDPDNHQRMTELRCRKIMGIAHALPEQEVTQGEAHGDVAVVGWGSTYGPIFDAVRRLRGEAKKVSHIHLTHLWPLPPGLGTLLKNFRKVIVPEMNMGQLVTLLRAQFLVPAEAIHKVSGQPFKITEIEAAVRRALEE